MFSCWFRSWYGCIVAILPAGCPRNRGLFPGKGKRLISSHKRPASLQWVLKAHFPEVKRPRCDGDNCLSSRAHAKKQWGYTFTPTYTSVAVIRTIIPCLLYAYIEPTLPAILLYFTVEISSQVSAGLLACLNSTLQDWSSCTTQGTIVRTGELTNSNTRPILPVTSFKSTENKAVSCIWILNHTHLFTLILNITIFLDVTPCSLVDRYIYVGRIRCLSLSRNASSRFLPTVEIHLPIYTTSHVRRIL
jgi:hypothetical protein